MKKLDKILSVVIIAIMLAFTCTNVFAGTISIDDISSSQNIGDAGTSMTKIGSVILTFVTNGAIILAVVLIAIIGVKYMMGSVEEKAEYKRSMMPYLIGAVLVFGAGLIGKLVQGLGSSFGA